MCMSSGNFISWNMVLYNDLWPDEYFVTDGQLIFQFPCIWSYSDDIPGLKSYFYFVSVVNPMTV